MLVIGDLSRLNAQRYPHKPALVMGEESVTYAQLDARSNQLAHALLVAGIGAGERVAILSHNRLEYAVVLQAVAKCGAMIVPLNFRFGAAEIGQVLSDAEPAMLFLEPEFEAAAREAIAALARPPALVLLAPGGDDSLAALMADRPATAPEVAVDPDSAAMVLYTSGTTGRPKGVLFSHAKFFRMFAATAIETRLVHEDVYLIAVPLFHTAGMNMALNQALFMGATGIVHRGRFDPATIFALIQRHRVTLAILVPTTVGLLAHHPDVPSYDLSSLNKIFYGSMPIAPQVLDKALRVFGGVRFNQIYGSTECGMVGILRAEDHVRHSQTTGREALLTACRIIGQDGAEVPVGEIGEVVVEQSRMGMMAYWRNDAATAETIRGGWIYSGDLARVEEQGFFTLVDRIKDVINSGGENIYPKEIETLIATHPAVREVAVFGIPDERYGETVCAALALHAGMTATAGEIEEFCAEHLARFKRPRRIEFHDALPRNASDKIMKTALRAPHWQGRSRMI
ncbi:class I adenylate-forming enzyme family protein [Pseudoduganella namucuonensis]|uniref:Fatty-acyl-CoA synthase n=1 Tax=Pseudoduganella namucuonensis TaxID=1035707 RepID=A0A1I7LDQ9_9BURK|nr:AMP-binding protein [Pseudoduganella namucuonensis]SFV07818.1 fatty-acyl-CoA synthase [Pseudoduganella namucuonensis]